MGLGALAALVIFIPAAVAAILTSSVLSIGAGLAVGILLLLAATMRVGRAQHLLVERWSSSA